ncbi:16S rRNA (adenine(1518)-N(6)/adenine(1519)-N(6))-dimethyltransferase RsmA [Wolbachia endosymbiont of Brugia malayi]|uniref:Ribosomal RNA small subunit methyltransferase A n=1 Tax=Wolbachia sp. subsp. Brugia malayi (strain TRS) TaxID=292805 RepID=RSMA_WOLTR|nr:16S rRNA (adenine(1518)-N(6)/adenine(1519)-N(6))-dimethyltransferase RsmA [Wolbachia endosymbiont of Brugia malayi]Q5GSM9.1 RecName: Full=Ribosomal RNA small subunit methyltransferase A; AltName: Full=16S rRNA (adenine(1518)-N(6)/adenine(1519)-N(6))-dimethyltransferase; AltName: Full=16S rRNA dimethyladenosine transferase; AltName: Full=16S rRNA dimethylase; AltName: Full=S-adenosylmethionine-6-N', N'-adenosyl(rRNA) dimethyltransferase [Wolbachia endosymbiont strain TRS of Brugia malayi]AAW709
MKKFLLKPKKSLGQNFILSSEITKRIVVLAGNLEDFNVIEIGPGYGALTKEILAHNPKSLLAIEKDSNLVKCHDQLLNEHQGKFRIVEADALYVVEEELIERPVKVIANLPYNISLALFLKWLNKIKLFTTFTLMFQKEVADRIIARPNSKDYGSLSVLSQLLCDIRREFDIEPKEFFPRPKVYSSVITVKPLPTQRFAVNLEALTKLTRAVFAQRRKMLRNSLQNVTNRTETALENAKLSGNERPKNLTVEQFCLLANNM